MKIINFILDLLLAAILGLFVGMALEEREIKKENERLREDIFQTIWVKCAREVNPQNNLVNMGIGDGSK